jgi:hypothetical protein
MITHLSFLEMFPIYVPCPLIYAIQSVPPEKEGGTLLNYKRKVQLPAPQRLYLMTQSISQLVTHSQFIESKY